MRELLLVTAVALMEIYGWFLVRKLDDFLEKENQVRKRQVLSDKVENEPEDADVFAFSKFLFMEGRREKILESGPSLVRKIRAGRI